MLLGRESHGSAVVQSRLRSGDRRSRVHSTAYVPVICVCLESHEMRCAEQIGLGMKSVNTNGKVVAIEVSIHPL
jgi:hypothetical protein